MWSVLYTTQSGCTHLSPFKVNAPLLPKHYQVNMGIDICAISLENQDAMEQDLIDHGLSINICNCNIPSWKTLFKICTGIQSILNYEWTVIPPLTVKEWYENASRIKSFCHDTEQEDAVEKIKDYLRIAAKYSASLQFC